MAIQLPNIPVLSSKVDTEVKRAFDSLKNWLTKIGSEGGMLTQGSLSQELSDIPATAALFDGSIPPQIQHLVVTGAFSAIMLTWDNPLYKYLAYVEVWRNTVDDIGTAQMVGHTVSTMYADTPPNSSMSVNYYYWVRIISSANIQGPFNSTGGTKGNTATDPTYALQVLTHQLTASQLHIDLNTRINLIDTDNVGIVSVLDRLGTSVAGLTAADSDRWERLLYERQVTDATVEIAPVAYCTLSAYTSEATCIAAGGLWKPGGTIRLKATADITTDVDAKLRTVTSELDAMNGTLVNTVSTVTAQGSTLTAHSSELSLLQDRILLATDSAYVDTKVNTVATAADVATFASQKSIPEALAYLILHNDDARRKLRSSAANIAIAQFDIKANSNAIEATASSQLLLAARVGDNAAAILAESTVRTSADSAIANNITTLQTTVGGHTLSIQTQSTAIDGLKGEYTVKIDNNGYVTGFGLASTANNGVPTSEFMVVADKFSIAPVATDAALSDGSPFFHLTVPAVIDGVTIPAGTYMKAAYIADATIVSAKIHSLAADKLVVPGTASIWDAIITTGKITNAYIGDVIQSTVYVPGSTGWFINKAGTVEFNGGTFRGAVVFTNSSSGYANISDRPANLAALNSTDGTTLSTASSNASSAVTATNNWVKPGQTTIDGNKIYTGDAYVDTLQIKGDAVTVPRNSYTPGAIVGGQIQSCIIPVDVDDALGYAMPVIVIASACASGTSNFDAILSYTIARNGVTIYSISGLLSGWPTAFSCTLTDRPGIGSHTYTFSASGPGSFSQRNLTLMGAAR